MHFKHRDCGGLVDTQDKRCAKCGKKWNFFTWLFNNEIRPVRASQDTYKKELNRRLK